MTTSELCWLICLSHLSCLPFNSTPRETEALTENEQDWSEWNEENKQKKGTEM